MKETLIYNNKEPYKIQYPLLDDEEIDFIKDIIVGENYPKELIPLVNKLYEYIGPEFLLLCALNLRKIQVVKDKKFKLNKYEFRKTVLTGAYLPNENKILYHEKDSLAHEFLHMCATPMIKMTEDEYYSGFRFDYDMSVFQKGLNEGYTELLTSRIFNNKNYNTDSIYKPSVYILRMFELLYASYKYMERDYFWANYQSPLANFQNFGTVEEYFTLLKHLDYFALTEAMNNEDIEIMNFMKKIIRRTYDENKILKSEQIMEEYLKTEEKPEQKIFSFFRK